MVSVWGHTAEQLLRQAEERGNPQLNTFNLLFSSVVHEMWNAATLGLRALVRSAATPSRQFSSSAQLLKLKTREYWSGFTHWHLSDHEANVGTISHTSVMRHVILFL